MAEENIIINPTERNIPILHLLIEKYIMFLKLEDSIMNQKFKIQWLREGGTNYKYIHSLVRGRRRILFIHRIRSENREWLQGYDTIGHAACDHF